MSEDWQNRTHILIGDEGIEKLRNAHVLVVGLGGVGGYAAEQLARAGIGEMTIVDVMTQYLKDQSIIDLMTQTFDFVVDAIDTLAPKVFLLYYAVQNHQNIVSCMGAGGKFNPEKIEIADISKSYNCRLAFYIRKRLHRLGIREGITVVFSSEKVNEHAFVVEDEHQENKIATVGTISYMPAIFGCFCASHVINKLLGR